MSLLTSLGLQDLRMCLLRKCSRTGSTDGGMDEWRDVYRTLCAHPLPCPPHSCAASDHCGSFSCDHIADKNQLNGGGFILVHDSGDTACHADRAGGNCRVASRGKKQRTTNADVQLSLCVQP